MGGDGGCLITRADCVKTKGYDFTKSSGGRYANSLGEMANYIQLVSEDRGLGPLERHRLRMSTCWLSQQPLQEPVVACRLGNLYNKEAIISALLAKSMPPPLQHICSLKDVKHCRLKWQEADGRKRIVCPVSLEDLDTGSSRAVLIWKTGAVVSVKSLEALKSKECPVTGKMFDSEKDLIPLVPDDGTLERLRAALPASSKKRKAIEDSTAFETSSLSASASSSAPPRQAVVQEVSKSKEEPLPKTARVAPTVEDKKGSVYSSLFIKDRKLHGLEGVRDAFGTPCYNRGAHM